MVWKGALLTLSCPIPYLLGQPEENHKALVRTVFRPRFEHSTFGIRVQKDITIPRRFCFEFPRLWWRHLMITVLFRDGNGVTNRTWEESLWPYVPAFCAARYSDGGVSDNCDWKVQVSVICSDCGRLASFKIRRHCCSGDGHVMAASAHSQSFQPFSCAICCINLGNVPWFLYLILSTMTLVPADTSPAELAGL
jgi:hypothetical protein